MVPEVIELIADWIEKDHHLCVVSLDQSHSSFIQPQRSSLWTSPTKSNTQSPIPGLVRWCTQAPIAQILANCANQMQNGQSNGPEHSTLEQTHKAELLWSRLHLAVLETVLGFPALPGANQLELITLADMKSITKDIVAMIREVKNKKLIDTPEGSAAIEAAIDRTVQVLQVSLTTGAFRCSLGKTSIDRFY